MSILYGADVTRLIRYDTDTDTLTEWLRPAVDQGPTYVSQGVNDGSAIIAVGDRPSSDYAVGWRFGADASLVDSDWVSGDANSDYYGQDEPLKPVEVFQEVFYGSGLAYDPVTDRIFVTAQWNRWDAGYTNETLWFLAEFDLAETFYGLRVQASPTVDPGLASITNGTVWLNGASGANYGCCVAPTRRKLYFLLGAEYHGNNIVEYDIDTGVTRAVMNAFPAGRVTVGLIWDETHDRLWAGERYSNDDTIVRLRAYDPDVVNWGGEGAGTPTDVVELFDENDGQILQEMTGFALSEDDSTFFFQAVDSPSADLALYAIPRSGGTASLMRTLPGNDHLWGLHVPHSYSEPVPDIRSFAHHARLRFAGPR